MANEDESEASRRAHKRDEPPEPPEAEADGAKDAGKSHFRDWWSTILSTLAFFISAIGFYLNFVQTDDLRVIFDEMPRLVVGSDKRLGAFGNLRVAFVNGGNQAAAIMKLEVYEYEDEPGVSGICQVTDPQVSRMTKVATELAPFVLKPGDIAVKDLAMSDMKSKAIKGDLGGYAGQLFAQLCVRVYFATPLSSTVDDIFFLFKYSATWIRSLNDGPKPATETELYFYQFASPKVYPIRHTSAIRAWWTSKPHID